MKTLTWAAVLFALSIFQAGRADEGDAKIAEISDSAHPGMVGWQVDYTRPADVPDGSISLFYKFWDPKVDGDVPSEKKLNLVLDQKAPAHVSFKVFLSEKESLVLIEGKKTQTGEGYPLSESFAVAKKPKRNSDGVYVLAQQSIDPKNPVAMGDTGEVVAWIELGIVPKS